MRWGGQHFNITLSLNLIQNSIKRREEGRKEDRKGGRKRRGREGWWRKERKDKEKDEGKMDVLFKSAIIIQYACI